MPFTGVTKDQGALPCQQRTVLQHVALCLQQEVTRPKA